MSGYPFYDPRPFASRDTKHRQSMLRVECPDCGRWLSQTLEGRPRRHKCLPKEMGTELEELISELQEPER